MPKMRITVGATHFGAKHSERIVFQKSHILAFFGSKERRPAATRMKFGGAGEQQSLTSPTVIGTDSFRVSELALKGWFSATLTQHMEFKIT
jgi:hypothetical protein